MRYVSLDIETTGLDTNRAVPIEIGAVLADTTSGRPLARFRVIPVSARNIRQFCEAWSLENLSDLLDEYERSSTGTRLFLEPGNYRTLTGSCRLQDVEDVLSLWLSLNHSMPSDKDGKHRVTVAGKNVASFDLPILQNSGALSGDRITVRHRMLDPAICFARHDDEALPNLSQCLERAGLPSQVSHQALDDAEQVVKLIHHAYSRKEE